MRPRSIHLLTLLLIAPAFSTGAALTQATLNAWNDHVRTANARVQERVRTGHFLWMDESPDRMRRVRHGEVVVSPVGDRHPERVPDGLIHDWIGGTFIPGAKVDEVLSVLRDYGRYKDYYSPTVVDSKTLSQTQANDRFSMVWLNKALFLTTALDSEYDSSYVQVDDKRWYSVACTTRVQQIENYREAGQHELPPDLGNGYIWRLCSISRFQERDGGVYVELEAMALSRPIPAAIHWVVEPVVARLSRNSLQLSLQQSREAVRTSEAAQNRSILLARLP